MCVHDEGCCFLAVARCQRKIDREDEEKKNDVRGELS